MCVLLLYVFKRQCISQVVTQDETGEKVAATGQKGMKI
jgi:hypothetical protein